MLVLAPLLVAIACWSLPRGIQAGDAGEFSTIMLTGGVPHPSGYPWMRVLGLLSRALWALGVSPITAASLPPALCGVAGYLLIHRCTDLLGHPRIGALVVLLAAISPLSVIHVNDSEVWGPHLLFSALFVHTVIRTRERPRPFVLGLSFGLAVSHHLTAVLLLPLAIGAALPDTLRGTLTGFMAAVVRNGAIGIAAGLIGLLPYASLAIGSGGGWRWGQTQTASGLLDHVLRKDFGTFSLSLHEEQVDARDSIARALTSVSEVFAAELSASAGLGLAIVLLALAGAGAATREHRDPPLALALGWGLSVLAAGLLFPGVGNIDPESPFGAWILERFDLLTVLLLIVPVTLALAQAGAYLQARAPTQRTRTLLRVGAWSIGVALIAGQLGSVLERGRPATERGVELAAIDLVSTPDPEGPMIPSAGEVPVRAIVIGTDDHRSFPVLYVQEVLGVGPHTLYVDARLLAYPWYRARLRERVPTLPDVDKPLALIGAIWSDPALADVPIYLANVFSRPAASLEKLPEGMLWRIPPPPASRDPADWTPARILERHLAACERMRITPSDFGGIEHPRGHPWSVDLRFAYIEKARALAAWLEGLGMPEAASQVLNSMQSHTGANQ